MADSFKKALNFSGDRKKEDSASRKSEKEDNYMTMTEKIKAKEEALLAAKKKSQAAWNDESNKKTFGVWDSVKFSFNRLWKTGCCGRTLFFFNIMMVFVVNFANVLNPLLLMLVVNSITCVEDCKYSEEETYALILMYTGIKLAYEVINTLRDIPYQRMAATAEITIADEVYHHV
jgi:hypothetical protein